jgi:hypothetical protein
MRHKRAVKRLINKIGGFRPYLEEDSPDKEKSEVDEVEETNHAANEHEWHDDRGEEDKQVS